MIMRIPYCLCILVALHAACFGGVTSEGRVWTVENGLIRVRVHADTGAFSVLDKRIGHTWTSAGSPRETPASVIVPQARQAPTIDANLNDWRAAATLKLTHDMVADAKQVKGPSDLSATVRVCWHGGALYLAVEVCDDKLQFGKPNEKQWWHWDSIEFWVGGTQCAFRLNDANVTFWCPNARVTGAEAKVRRAVQGYVVEARVPLANLLSKAGVGKRFPFAIGVNDADAVGGRREG